MIRETSEWLFQEFPNIYVGIHCFELNELTSAVELIRGSNLPFVLVLIVRVRFVV